MRCPACGGGMDCRDLGQVLFEHEGSVTTSAAGSTAMRRSIRNWIRAIAAAGRRARLKFKIRLHRR